MWRHVWTHELMWRVLLLKEINLHHLSRSYNLRQQPCDEKMASGSSVFPGLVPRVRWRLAFGSAFRRKTERGKGLSQEGSKAVCTSTSHAWLLLSLGQPLCPCALRPTPRPCLDCVSYVSRAMFILILICVWSAHIRHPSCLSRCALRPVSCVVCAPYCFGF